MCPYLFDFRLTPHMHTDTGIVPVMVKVAMAGIPLTPVDRVAGAIFYAATDPDMETSGCTWLLPDGGYVFRLNREELKHGVYEMIDARARTALVSVTTSS